MQPRSGGGIIARTPNPRPSRLLQQPPSLAIFLKPLLTILSAPERIKINRQPPAQSPHRNQIPDPPTAHPLPLNHHRQKINLLRRVRHMLSRSPPARPHREPVVMRRPASLNLHPPQPPRSVHNHVIALIIPKRSRHPKPAPRRIQHELHLSHLSHMLRVIPLPQSAHTPHPLNPPPSFLPPPSPSTRLPPPSPTLTIPRPFTHIHNPLLLLSHPEVPAHFSRARDLPRTNRTAPAESSKWVHNRERAALKRRVERSKMEPGFSPSALKTQMAQAQKDLRHGFPHPLLLEYQTEGGKPATKSNFIFLNE